MCVGGVMACVASILNANLRRACCLRRCIPWWAIQKVRRTRVQQSKVCLDDVVSVPSVAVSFNLFVQGCTDNYVLDLSLLAHIYTCG